MVVGHFLDHTPQAEWGDNHFLSEDSLRPIWGFELMGNRELDSTSEPMDDKINFLRWNRSSRGQDKVVKLVWAAGLEIQMRSRHSSKAPSLLYPL